MVGRVVQRGNSSNRIIKTQITLKSADPEQRTSTKVVLNYYPETSKQKQNYYPAIQA
jgi:hypothetical protein